MGDRCALRVSRWDVAVDWPIINVSSVKHSNFIIGFQVGNGYEDNETPILFFGVSLLVWTLQLKIYFN